MTNCDDCDNLIRMPDGPSACFFDVDMTEEDITAATQGRCPYFKGRGEE